MKLVKTNGRGVASTSVTPARAGIVVGSVTGTKKGCNTARIGVIGALEPPVTG
jgi:hypothetical protein